MLCQKLLGLGPERWDGLGVVVQGYGEAVGFVVVSHVAEDIIVDVAEEVHFGLDPPVVASVGKGGVFVEHAAVPATHLVVGDEAAILDILFFEHCGGFLEEGGVDP